MPTSTTNPVVNALKVGEEYLAAKKSLATLINEDVLLFVEQVDNGDVLVNPWAEAHDLNPQTLQYHLCAWRLLAMDGVAEAGDCLSLAVRAHGTKGFGYAKMRKMLKEGNYATRDAAYLAVERAINDHVADVVAAEVEAENKAEGFAPPKPKGPGKPPTPLAVRLRKVEEEAEKYGLTISKADAEAACARIMARVK